MTSDKILTAAMKHFAHRTVTRAMEDAALFVEEFGEPLNAAETDWDAVAFGEFAREQQMPDDMRDALWPIYSWALVQETGKLTGR